MVETYTNVYDFLRDKLTQLQDQGRAVISTNPDNTDTIKEELLELPHQFFRITDSPAVIFNLPHFKTQPWWMVGELLTEFLNINPPMMSKYSPDIIEASYTLTPQGTCEYMYGTRWAEHNQFENIRRRLAENPSSKKLLVQTWMPSDADSDRKDAPCNVSYMMLAREGKLDLTATIRSNDIFRGVKYDYYLASFMQQSAAAWSGLEVGDLYFHINSLHMYSSDLKHIDSILIDLEADTEGPIRLEVPGGYSSEQYWYDLRKVKLAEEAAYSGAWENVRHHMKHISTPEFCDLAAILAVKNAKHYKQPEVEERFKEYLQTPEVRRWLGYGQKT